MVDVKEGDAVVEEEEDNGAKMASAAEEAY